MPFTTGLGGLGPTKVDWEFPEEPPDERSSIAPVEDMDLNFPSVARYSFLPAAGGAGVLRFENSIDPIGISVSKRAAADHCPLPLGREPAT